MTVLLINTSSIFFFNIPKVCFFDQRRSSGHVVFWSSMNWTFVKNNDIVCTVMTFNMQKWSKSKLIHAMLHKTSYRRSRMKWKHSFCKNFITCFTLRCISPSIKYKRKCLNNAIFHHLLLLVATGFYVELLVYMQFTSHGFIRVHQLPTKSYKTSRNYYITMSNVSYTFKIHFWSMLKKLNLQVYKKKRKLFLLLAFLF